MATSQPGQRMCAVLRPRQRDVEIVAVNLSSRHVPSDPRRWEVRPSNIHGQGVFATALLPRRRKLGELVGRVVRLPQARRHVEGREKIYLVELSRRLALDCSDSNEFKFLNHSCRPNCYLRVFRRRIEVYTLSAIQPGAELTVDYGETPHKGGMACRCGRSDCKQRL